MKFHDDHGYERLADFIIDLTSHTEIISHDEGKIRLKVSLAAYSLAMKGMDGINLTEALNGFNGIKKYNFSFLWRTLDIDYDKSKIPSHLWEDLVNVEQSPSNRPKAKENLVDILSQNPHQT